MKTFTYKFRKKLFGFLLVSCSQLALSIGPQITIEERDVNYKLIRTLDFKSELPQKNLTKTVNGHKMLNVDPSKSQ